MKTIYEWCHECIFEDPGCLDCVRMTLQERGPIEKPHNFFKENCEGNKDNINPICPHCKRPFFPEDIERDNICPLCGKNCLDPVEMENE